MTTVTSEREPYAPLRDGLHALLDLVEARLGELPGPNPERVSLLAARNLLRGACNCLRRAERGRGSEV